VAAARLHAEQLKAIGVTTNVEITLPTEITPARVNGAPQFAWSRRNSPVDRWTTSFLSTSNVNEGWADKSGESQSAAAQRIPDRSRSERYRRLLTPVFENGGMPVWGLAPTINAQTPRLRGMIDQGTSYQFMPKATTRAPLSSSKRKPNERQQTAGGHLAIGWLVGEQRRLRRRAPQRQL
jgi:hypothetical protein